MLSCRRGLEVVAKVSVPNTGSIPAFSAEAPDATTLCELRPFPPNPSSCKQIIGRQGCCVPGLPRPASGTSIHQLFDSYSAIAEDNGQVPILTSLERCNSSEMLI